MASLDDLVGSVPWPRSSQGKRGRALDGRARANMTEAVAGAQNSDLASGKTLAAMGTPGFAVPLRADINHIQLA